MHLLGSPRIEPVINYTVISEYTYYLLAIEGHKSPRSIKESREISEVLSRDYPAPFLSIFSIVPSSNDVTAVFLDMMSRHNLLPNDALILADCKLNNIDALASYDVKDFATACRQESIKLITSISDLAHP